MGKIGTVCIRFNLDRPDDRTAWEYLHSPDKQGSCSRLVITAINAYIKQQENPNYNLVQQLKAVVDQSLDEKLPHYLATVPSPIPSEAKISEPDDFNLDDVDLDFIGF